MTESPLTRNQSSSIAMAGAGPSVVADLAPASRRGAYQGAFGMTYSIAACIAPIAGSRGLATFGSAPFWSSCFVVSAAAGAGFVALGQARRASATQALAEGSATSASA